MAKLTAKQKRFVEEYLIDFNATQAAIRAGYSEKSAAYLGYETLTKPYVAEIVDKAKKEMAERAIMKADEVKMLTTEIARDKEERTADRISALKLMATIHDLLNNNVLHSGEITINEVRRTLVNAGHTDG